MRQPIPRSDLIPQIGPAVRPEYPLPVRLARDVDVRPADGETHLRRIPRGPRAHRDKPVPRQLDQYPVPVAACPQQREADPCAPRQVQAALHRAVGDVNPGGIAHLPAELIAPAVEAMQVSGLRFGHPRRQAGPHLAGWPRVPVVVPDVPRADIPDGRVLAASGLWRADTGRVIAGSGQVKSAPGGKRDEMIVRRDHVAVGGTSADQSLTRSVDAERDRRARGGLGDARQAAPGGERDRADHRACATVSTPQQELELHRCDRISECDLAAPHRARSGLYGYYAFHGLPLRPSAVIAAVTADHDLHRRARGYQRIDSGRHFARPEREPARRQDRGRGPSFCHGRTSLPAGAWPARADPQAWWADGDPEQLTVTSRRHVGQILLPSRRGRRQARFWRCRRRGATVGGGSCDPHAARDQAGARRGAQRCIS